MNTMGVEKSDVNCRGCEEKLYEFDSFLVCAMERCSRMGEPVDFQGRTDEEAQVEAIAPLVPDDDATGFTSEDDQIRRFSERA